MRTSGPTVSTAHSTTSSACRIGSRRAVVGAIEPKLRQSEIERASRKPTESLDAYDLYLRAVASRYGYTEAGIREAVALLERALAIDPTYASAAAMIGWCRIHQLAHGLGTVSDAEISEAVRLARRAIEAGKDDPDVLWMSGYTLMRFAGEPATAGNLVDHAVALNPNSAHAWHVRGVFLLLAQDPEGAIAPLEHAMRLSPVDPLGRAFSTAVAGAHFGAHRYESAEDWADRSLAMQPNYRPALHLKAACCAHLGRVEEARVWADRILELEPGLTIARWKTMVPPFPPDLLVRYEDGLRKAGLPEE